MSWDGRGEGREEGSNIQSLLFSFVFPLLLRLKAVKDAEALQSARRDIANLLEEKRTLLDTVRSLQSQLSTPEEAPKFGQGNR